MKNNMWWPLLDMVNSVKRNSCLTYSSHDEVMDLTETLKAHKGHVE